MGNIYAETTVYAKNKGHLAHNFSFPESPGVVEEDQRHSSTILGAWMGEGALSAQLLICNITFCFIIRNQSFQQSILTAGLNSYEVWEGFLVQFSKDKCFPSQVEFSRKTLVIQLCKELVITVHLCVKTLRAKRRPLYLKPQPVPRCKHFSSRL